MQNLDSKKKLILLILLAIQFILFFFISCMCCFLCYCSNFFESSDASKIIGFFTPTMVAIWTYIIYNSPQE